MKNNEGTGISCDYCGAPAHTDFSYYSFDFRKITVTNGVKDVLQELTLSVDICEQCMEIYRERVVQAYKPSKPGQFICEISGEIIIASSLIYYMCDISAVQVNLSAQSYICNNCKKLTNSDKPCICGGTVISRTAAIVVNDKYLQINFSASIYEKFIKYIESIKQLGESEWVTA